VRGRDVCKVAVNLSRVKYTNVTGMFSDLQYFSELLIILKRREKK